MRKQAVLLLAHLDEEWKTVERLRDRMQATVDDSPDELTEDDAIILGYALREHN